MVLVQTRPLIAGAISQLPRYFVYIKTFDKLGRIFAARIIVSLPAISVVPQQQAVQLSNCSCSGQISATVTLGLRRPGRRRSRGLIPTEKITRFRGRRCRTVFPNSIKSKLHFVCSSDREQITQNRRIGQILQVQNPEGATGNSLVE